MVFVEALHSEVVVSCMGLRRVRVAYAWKPGMWWAYIKGGLLPVNTASTEFSKLRALFEPLLLLPAAALALSI